MHKKITRPSNPYSTLWATYNAQNPGLHRSVGADGDNGDEITVESLQESILKMQTSMDSMTAQNTTLQEANDKWKDKNAETEKHRKEQERAAKEAIAEAARKSGDVKALEGSWNEKLTALQTSSDATISAMNLTIQDITVGAEARSMALNIALEGSADVLRPHIASRLKMEMVDGVPVVKVLDVNGKPSALSLEDLSNEFSENKAFAPVIKGSSASGGGRAGESGGQSGENVMKRSDFNSLSQLERGEFFKKKGAKLVD